MNSAEKSSRRLKRLLFSFAVTIIATIGIGVSASPVYAADGLTTVYITNTGKCYHAGNCNSLSKSKIPTTLEEAVGSGYKACSKCSPPILTAASAATRSTTKASSDSDNMVWQSATGKCYHSINNCGQMNPSKAKQITESQAISKGLKKCSKCW